MPRAGAMLLSDLVEAGIGQLGSRATNATAIIASALENSSPHGPNMRLPDLRERIAVGYPRLDATSIHDRCGAYFPTLAKRL
jgi:uncharacterized protein with HEPN domain